MLGDLRDWGGRRGGGGGGHDRKLLTGKVVLQRSKKVSDDGHAPRLPQNLLPLLPVHVPHVSVVFWEPKDSARPRKRFRFSQGAD